MHSISLFVTAICMVFVYRAQSPEAVMRRAGLNPHNETVMRQPVLRFAARVRIVTGFIIMVLTVVASQRLPVEISNAIARAQDRQVQLQGLRTANRLEAEKRHVNALINALGGPEGYLSYLSYTQDHQNAQK